MKGLLEKIQETSKCIEERRSKATFSLKNTKEVVNNKKIPKKAFCSIELFVLIKGYVDRKKPRTRNTAFYVVYKIQDNARTRNNDGNIKQGNGLNFIFSNKRLRSA